eukprot:4148976-Heterocapsa_arctica.AAC.1
MSSKVRTGAQLSSKAMSHTALFDTVSYSEIINDPICLKTVSGLESRRMSRLVCLDCCYAVVPTVPARTIRIQASEQY